MSYSFHIFQYIYLPYLLFFRDTANQESLEDFQSLDDSDEENVDRNTL